MKSATSWVALLLALLTACSKSKGSSSEALHAGDLLVQIALDPDPPRAGDNLLRVTVKDAQGKPVDGARVGFVYDMPAMGGMPEMKGNGESKALGGGKYDVSYSLSMLGDWYIMLGIEAPGTRPRSCASRCPHRARDSRLSHAGPAAEPAKALRRCWR